MRAPPRCFRRCRRPLPPAVHAAGADGRGRSRAARSKFRRLQTENDDAFNQTAMDALLNFETVKYFCAGAVPLAAAACDGGVARVRRSPC